MKIQNETKLDYWQRILSKNEYAYAETVDKMDKREALYRGDSELYPIVDGHKDGEETKHVYNIIAENIETEVDSNIPQPKVRARRKGDEDRARLIEDLIRNEIDRMPMEEYNDLMERIVPIQGGGYWLVEWDDTIGSFYRTGENAVTVLHPKAVIPQDGVSTSIEDMDYIIIKQPETKGYIKRRYGIDVDDESESEPDVRTVGEYEVSDDMVTIYTAYYKNDEGRICKFSWCNNIVIEDIEDYQARRHRMCQDCGAMLPYDEERIREMQPLETETDVIEEQIATAIMALDAQLGETETEAPKIDTSKPKEEKVKCPYCGSTKLKECTDDHEQILEGFTTSRGIEVPGARIGIGKDGKPAVIPTLIPSYKPDVYPLILQRNITLYGKLLGESDVDKIAPQQNALNWHMRSIDERLLGAGSVIALPKNTHIDIDPRNNKVWRLDNMQDLAMVRVLDFASDLSSNFAQINQVYNNSRNILGITDSFQGRKDTTATSGTAKQFAAAQSAGRMESKRTLKRAAWAKIFELIFKFTLAYAEEPRQVTGYDNEGNITYEEFDRWDFLEQDPNTGEYYWDDDFIFSCDSAAPLASNREAMWQECRELFMSGAYGELGNLDTQILFWSEMDRLHFPLAGAAKEHLMLLKEQQMQEAQQMQEMQMQGLLDADGNPIPQNALPESTQTPTGEAGFTAPNGERI